MKTHHLMSRVHEKVGLLKLLLGLMFLFFGLLKQVNITISVILLSGWPKIFKQKYLLSHSLSEKK